LKAAAEIAFAKIESGSPHSLAKTNRKRRRGPGASKKATPKDGKIHSMGLALTAADYIALIVIAVARHDQLIKES
jgi:hypothetical protein